MTQPDTLPTTSSGLTAEGLQSEGQTGRVFGFQRNLQIWFGDGFAPAAGGG